MSHQLVLTSKNNCRKRLLSVQVTTTLVSLAGMTPSTTITTTTNQTREAQVHTQPICAFRSTQPMTRSNSAHESSTSARGVFPADQRTWHLLLHLKKTNGGGGGCHSQWQDPGLRFQHSDAQIGVMVTLLGACLFLCLLLYLWKSRNPDFYTHDWFIYYSIWIGTMLWIFNYILIIVLVINFNIFTFLSSFQSELWLIFKLFKYYLFS